MPENNEPSFEEIMQFDPFGGQDTGAEPPVGQASAAGDAQGQQAQDQQQDQQQDTGQQDQHNAEGQQQAPAPTAPPPRPVTQEDLVAAVRASTESIARNMQPQQQAPQQRPSKFNLGIPDQLLGALRSEDQNEFRAGVGALVNSMANHIWENFQMAIRDEFAPAVRQMISQHQTTQSQQDQVSRDFYGTYPQLNNPVFAPMIQSVGAQIAEEYARAGRSFDWSPQMRDEIARRVMDALQTLTPQPQQQVRQPQRRAFSTGNGARPVQNTDVNSPDEMQRMIFGPN